MTEPMYKLLHLTCPHCQRKFVQCFDIQKLNGDLLMVFCDNEEDRGCGHTFAIKNAIAIKTTVYKLQEQTQ